MPLIFYLYFIKKQKGKDDIYLKIIKIIHILVLLFILYSTNGRMAILSTFILMSVYMFLERRKINIKYVLFFIFTISILLILIFINKGIVNSKIIITEQITNSLSVELREEIIKNSLNIFKDNFLFGVGPGQFSIVYPYYSIGNELVFIHHLHNDYIQFLVEYGLFGIFIILFLYYKLIILVINGVKKLKGNSYHIFLATIFSILIFHLEIIVSFQSHIDILFKILIFLVGSLYIIIYNFDKHYKSNSDELL